MAIVQISRIQQRRGLQQDLPQLASAEFGWSVDKRRLFIGNGTLEEGAPKLGTTEILTSESDVLAFLKSYTFKGLSAGYQVVTGVDSLNPVVRTLQDKIDDYVSVKDFGATGDGVTDDTAAIQRALDNAYSTNQITSQNNYHRTIYFPAGTYNTSATLFFPPYSRIQGEGKRTTIIKSSFPGATAQFKDSAGQHGVTFANGNTDASEYHFSDISFWQAVPAQNQPCLVIDGCFTATFNRVMFRGSLGTDGASNYYDYDRGTGVALVAMNNQSNYDAIRNVVFSQCDFIRYNYGIELNQDSHGITIGDCYFDALWSAIYAGYNSPDPANYIPFGITIRDNYFRYSAIEAIKCGPYVREIMSIGNTYFAAGLYDWEAATPTHNTNGLASFPAITFNYKNNYSIADSFDRTDADYALYPNIQTNGNDCYIVGQDLGIVNGRQTSGRGHTLTLANASSFTGAGITYIPSAYSNLTMDYSLTHNSSARTGTFKIVRVGTTFVYEDDFVETGSTGVYFQANTTTGDIEYTSSSVGSAATLTYSLKYFTA